MATKIQLRRGTAAQWVAANPVLAEGEIGIETDTKQIKIGDGLKEWTLLTYIATGNMDVASSDLDDLADGTSYKRIQAAKALKINGGTFSPDDLAEGSTYKKTTAAGAEAANSIGAISDAAGDLIVATGANSFKKLGLGIAGQVLQVNPGANDVEWASVNALSVTQVANAAALPNPGDANTLYRTADDGKLFRLAAAPNTYAEVPSSLALGELSTNAYRGDRGKTAYDFSQAVASESVKGGLELADNTEILAGSDNTRALTPGHLKTALASDGMWLTKRTKMPDGATAVYSQDAWAAGHGWISGELGCTLSLPTDGVVRATRTDASSGAIGIQGPAASVNYYGKTYIFRYRCPNMTNGLNVYANTSSKLIASFAKSTDWAIGICTCQRNESLGYNLFFRSGGSESQNAYFEIDWIWVGDYSYLTGSLSEEAARIADQLGDTAGVGVAASGTITSNGVRVSVGDTITIAGKTYTFVDTLTGANGEVLRHATDWDKCLQRFVYALRRYAPLTYNYPAVGAVYSITDASAHSLVTSTIDAGVSPLNLTAINSGILGNQITLAKSAATLTLSGTTLTGGIDDVGAKLSYQVARSSQQLTAKTSGVQADYEMLLDSADGFIKKKVLKSNLETTTQAAGKRALYNAAAGLNANSISFPATQVASADANTLDDYEEGTITPVIGGSSTAGTYELAANASRYTKKGQEVTCYFDFTLAAVLTGGGAGNLSLTGFPFSRTASNLFTASVFPYDGSLSAVPVYGVMTSAAQMLFYSIAGGAGKSILPISELAAGDRFILQLSYVVA